MPKAVPRSITLACGVSMLKPIASGPTRAASLPFDDDDAFERGEANFGRSFDEQLDAAVDEQIDDALAKLEHVAGRDVGPGEESFGFAVPFDAGEIDDARDALRTFRGTGGRLSGQAANSAPVTTRAIGGGGQANSPRGQRARIDRWRLRPPGCSSPAESDVSLPSRKRSERVIRPDLRELADGEAVVDDLAGSRRPPADCCRADARGGPAPLPLLRLCGDAS